MTIMSNIALLISMLCNMLTELWETCLASSDLSSFLVQKAQCANQDLTYILKYYTIMPAGLYSISLSSLLHYGPIRIIWHKFVKNRTQTANQDYMTQVCQESYTNCQSGFYIISFAQILTQWANQDHRP